MAPTWLTPRAAAQADSVNSPLAISIIWGIYQIVPYALVLFYWLVSKGVMLQYMCRLGLLVTFVSGAAAVGLMWGLYPPSYSFAKVQPSHTVRDMLVGLLQPLELTSVLLLRIRVPASRAFPSAHASKVAGGAVRLVCLHRGGSHHVLLCRLQHSPTSTTMLSVWVLFQPTMMCRGGTAP